nr:uncharacterized protein LOC127485571 [Oryctolagus cuniculus]XP_051684676.1 uncharacterized protein LOC127485571 [Oryctolagus cuniculus]XP_051684677.1 uncharacterized protein LOC127485571 [Oryctolagus cuniculus]
MGAVKMARVLGPWHPCGRADGVLVLAWLRPGCRGHFKDEPAARALCLSLCLSKYMNEYFVLKAELGLALAPCRSPLGGPVSSTESTVLSSLLCFPLAHTLGGSRGWFWELGPCWPRGCLGAGSLLAAGEAQIRFQVPCFGLAQPQLLWVWEVNWERSSLSVSLPLNMSSNSSRQCVGDDSSHVRGPGIPPRPMLQLQGETLHSLPNQKAEVPGARAEPKAEAWGLRVTLVKLPLSAGRGAAAPRPGARLPGSGVWPSSLGCLPCVLRLSVLPGVSSLCTEAVPSSLGCLPCVLRLSVLPGVSSLSTEAVPSSLGCLPCVLSFSASPLCVT